MVHAVSGFDQPVTVPAEQGANRFVWNMRVAGARDVGAAMRIGFLGGPVALPGTYQVRLTVNGQAVTRPFEIRRDPRLTVTDDDLKSQFDFLLSVRDKLTEVHDAVLDVRDIRARVQQWVTRTEGLPGAGPLAGAAKELNSELDRIEDALIQWRAEAFEDTFHYPVRLNNRLATIADLTNMASSAPTRQMLELYVELEAKADAQLTGLEEVRNRECATFGDALRELAIPPIRVRPREDRG